MGRALRRKNGHTLVYSITFHPYATIIIFDTFFITRGISTARIIARNVVGPGRALNTSVATYIFIEFTDDGLALA